MAFMLGSSISLATERIDASMDTTIPTHRVALRLQSRLLSRGIPAPLEEIVAAVQDRRTLLGRSLHVLLSTEKKEDEQTWSVGPQRYPLWVSTRATSGHVATHIDTAAVEATLLTGELPLPQAPINIVVDAVTQADGVVRALSAGVAKPGYILNLASAAESIGSALHEGQSELTLYATFTPGMISNASDMPLGDLQLIGTGFSNFAGSPDGRMFNVRKALREHVNNVVVPAGAEFSFNGILGGPVSERRGWRKAKVINAGELTMEPGGGICQASTTLYRGILRAGLPIGKRRSHSMYVSYYEKGGVGLDATVYYGHQDFTFINDTGNPILIQAYDDGTDAHVLLYGTPDGRTATMEGPFFAGAVPREFQDMGETITTREIGWIQRVTRSDGIVETYPILSTYKELPRSIVYKYTALTAR
jgi:hypothetical protein